MQFSFRSAMVISLLVLCSSCASSGPKTLSQEDQEQYLLNLAAASISENDASSAIAQLSEAEKINASNPRLHFLYALAYYKKQAIDEAIASAKKALALKPDYPEAKNTLGRLLMDQGHMQEAEKLLRDAASNLKYNESYIARTNLGILYFREGKLDLARAELTRVIQSEPETGCLASYYRGQVNLQENRLEQAQKDFAAGSKNFCSGNYQARLELGKTLIRERDYDTARSELVELKRLYPDSAEADEATKLIKELP